MNIGSREQLLDGASMPTIGLGTWELTDNTEDCVAEAISVGYRMIDTSSDYGTQPGVGQGIKKSGISREDLYIVTKVEENDDGYERMFSNLDELQLDYVDLVLIHRPPEDNVGEEIWPQLVKAREGGLTKSIGVSNYSERQIQSLYDLVDEIPVVNQIEWSPFGWSQSMLDFCEENRIVLQSYSPLTRGERLKNELIVNMAERYEKTPAQILIRWSIEMGVTPLPKASSIDYIRDNIDVFDWSLDEVDINYLCELDEEYSALGERPVYLNL